MPRPFALVIALALAFSAPASAQPPRTPDIEDLLAIKTVSGVRISPDGRWVVYGVTEADLEQDAYVTQLWLVPSGGGAPIQLTRGTKSAGNVQWSPDGQWIGFTSTRAGDKNQIFAIRPDGGEAVPLTKSESGVTAFEWSADGARIAYLAPDAESSEHKARKDRLGDFEIVRREYAYSQIWTLDVAEARTAPVAGKALTKGTAFSVDSVAWSPDGARLAFSAARNPDLVQGHTSDIYTLDVATGTVVPIVTQAGPDSGPRWSPDGTRIAFETAMGRADFFHANGRIAVVPASGGPPVAVTAAFDEDASLLDWTTAGIVFSGLQKTTSHLFAVDPATRAITRMTQPDSLIGTAFSLSSDGSMLAFAAASPTTMLEVYATSRHAFEPRKLTELTRQLGPFRVGTREVVSWKSQDGATIEGVLVRPADFDPAKKYPLLVIIHGGPTGIDRPVLIENRYYPVDAWVGRGALVLKVNYRGSAGYGERFRQLNVRNLGVGDAWDVVSGIDHLVKAGSVDAARVGCMGWSQGGYISAYLTTATTRCAAVSVGAGISNWATYYFNTDITPFTIQYLGDDPADDPAIYQKTSPMTYIRQARTPTLIQHGENDRRVPIPNAYELRQGLEDRGVPVTMVVYKGFGHGISKPKAMRAVMRHNLEWFNHYLWSDTAPDLVTPSLPLTLTTEDGGRVSAEEYGSGERAVVLAHGGRFTKESWAPQARRLAQAGFRVVAIDFRGRGQSGGGRTTPPDEGVRFDVLAAARYLREGGAKTVSVVGGSFGGGAAAEAMAAKPGEIDRIVLLAAPVEAPERLAGRKLFIVSRDDANAAGPRLPRITSDFEKASEPKSLVVLDGDAHAQFLFSTDQGERLMEEILKFLSAP